MFSAKAYDQASFELANAELDHTIDLFEGQLRVQTASLAAGADAVCIFVNDIADGEVLGVLASLGVRHIALRCAGFNNVDLDVAARLA